MIVTSRSEEIAPNIVEYNEIIEFEPMSQSEAVNLLQQKIQKPLNDPMMIQKSPNW